jgi:hypothetical protein
MEEEPVPEPKRQESFQISGQIQVLDAKGYVLS